MGLIGSAPSDFTLTLTSLANNAIRGSAGVDNTNGYNVAIVSVQLKSGSVAPNAGIGARVYLVRSDDGAGIKGDIQDDDWIETDAALTNAPENMQLLHPIFFTASTNKEFHAIFSTAELGPLGPKWGIAVENVSGQAFNSTSNTSFARYRYIKPDAT